jgi:hypothetical protein
MKPDQKIERKIVIGLITSTEFIHRIQPFWDGSLLQSSMAKRLSAWCLDHFEKFQKAPGPNIEDIFFEKMKRGLPKELAEEISEDILPDLSDEYVEDSLNIDYLIKQTQDYLQEQHLLRFGDQIRHLLEGGEINQAEELANNYAPLIKGSGSFFLDLGSDQALEVVEKAFEESYQPVIRYPKQLGDFWNHQLVKGGFIALMASEKRGKSYWLLDMAIRATRQGKKVAFFQAGDMTERQQIRRIGIHLLKRSDREKYCGKMFEPIRDCIHNQRDTCDREERECDFGILADWGDKKIRDEITLEELIKRWKEHPDYRPCFNCKEYQSRPWGAVWVNQIDVGSPINGKEARQAFDRFFAQTKRRLLLSTHSNGSLSVGKMRGFLNLWEKQEDFIPDLIIVDYADLLTTDSGGKDFRHQQNEIWKGLRALSQEKNQPLVVTVTQADADSYDRKRLSLKNFSEDKRKYAHVTAMFGLNQDKTGREKKLGIMRINELVIREDFFDGVRDITVLQNLSRGLPLLSSYWG